MVSGASMVMMVVAMLFGIAVPVILAIYGKKKLGCSLRLFLLGCIIFFCFAIILEGIMHTLILGTNPSIQDNIIIFGLYGGFMAGLFEETGRLFAFKFFCKKNMANDKNSLMYGFGHGGFEALYLLVPGMISNLVMANLINSGNTEVLMAGQSAEYVATIQSAIDAVVNTTAPTFLLGMLERVSAVSIHIALSVVVWYAVKNAKYYYFVLAIALHMLVDTITVIIGKQLSALVVEIIILLLAAGLCYVASLIWKKEHINDQTETV